MNRSAPTGSIEESRRSDGEPAGPVLHVTRMLPTYRVPVLETLNERLGGRLVVGAGAPPSGSSMESLAAEPPFEFEFVELANTWIGGETIHWQRYAPIFDRHPDPAVLLAEESPRTLSLPWLLRRARRAGAARVLWGHFSSNDRRFSPYHPLDRYRLEMARRVEACVCYTEAIRQILRTAVPEERLFVARNTVDTATLNAERDELERRGRSEVRSELDLPGEAPVLLFLGRLIPKKGTDLLIEAFGRLRSKRTATLLVIGDGPERTAMEKRVRREEIPDVRFLGAITEEHRLAPYLYAADLLLNPGYLGLSVNQAFTFGLPVIAQEAPADRRFHSPEIAYVRSGENGVLVPWGETAEMVSAIETVIEDRARFSDAARRFADEHLGVDRMVDHLEEAISFAARTRHSA